MSASAFILAGGVGKRLSILTRFRAKPAVPFAGRYRIIDFTLSNCVHSGITDVYVLTQYISRSLISHIGIGKPWDLDRLTGGLHVLHPHLGPQAADWYQGTADAIYQNLSVLEEVPGDEILILSGDHVYRADYGEFIRFHRETGAPATIGVVGIDPANCREFGIATVDAKHRITKFEEKPEQTEADLASMGIYVFDRKFLLQVLRDLKKRHDNLDFGKHVLPYLVKRRQVAAWRYGGYWLDIGTLDAYYRASLDLLAERSRVGLHRDRDPVFTVTDDRPPLSVSREAGISRSLVCNGCVIRGSVENSVLSPGVVVEKGAVVRGSVVFHDTVVRRGAVVRDAIVDKHCVIGRGASIGDGDRRVLNKLQPGYLDFGLTLVGRKTRIPGGTVIGTNCLVCGPPGGGAVPRLSLGDGEYYIARDR